MICCTRILRKCIGDFLEFASLFVCGGDDLGKLQICARITRQQPSNYSLTIAAIHSTWIPSKHHTQRVGVSWIEWSMYTSECLSRTYKHIQQKLCSFEVCPCPAPLLYTYTYIKYMCAVYQCLSTSHSSTVTGYSVLFSSKCISVTSLVSSHLEVCEMLQSMPLKNINFMCTW